MKFEKIVSSSYSIIEHFKGKYRLVKIIGEYDGDEGRAEACQDRTSILLGNVSEEEIEMEKWRKLRDEDLVD